MKKLCYITIALAILLFFVACGAKSPINSSKSSTNITTASAVTPTDIKITYTKELTYLPSYNGVQSTEYTPASKKTPLATAKYNIQNTTDAKVYQDYENILKEDGWTISQDAKYYNIVAKKGTHMVNVTIQKLGKDVILALMSK